jgi:hypothetical protein
LWRYGRGRIKFLTFYNFIVYGDQKIRNGLK